MPEISFDSVPDFLKFPKDLYLGEASAVAVDSKGHVFGRKQEAPVESTGPLKHPNPPLPAVDGRFREPTDVPFDAGKVAQRG